MDKYKHYAKILASTLHSKALNELPISARWLYVVFLGEAHGKHVFEMRYKEIEKITGFGRATVRRAIRSLVEAGFLTYEHGGLRNPNVYTLNEHWLTKN